MKRILFIALTVLLCAGLLCGCTSTKRIHAEYPIFIKTIDRPDEGTGEVIMVSVSITGQWSVDDSDSTQSYFRGTIKVIGLDDYWSRIGDQKVDVNIDFAWESDHWVGEIPYISTDGKAKTLLVYTDEQQSVWVFEGPDRISFAPADHINDVLDICSKLGIELK